MTVNGGGGGNVYNVGGGGGVNGGSSVLRNGGGNLFVNGFFGMISHSNCRVCESDGALATLVVGGLSVAIVALFLAASNLSLGGGCGGHLPLP